MESSISFDMFRIKKFIMSIQYILMLHAYGLPGYE